jgi:hypothetical protein
MTGAEENGGPRRRRPQVRNVALGEGSAPSASLIRQEEEQWQP